jgi:SAM-dependent methyltransferase
MRSAQNVRGGIKLLEPEARALVGAKFSAWWNGAPFDEEAFRAAREAIANEPGFAGADSELFDPAPDPRLDGLARLWGERRVMPSSDEARVLELLGAADTGALTLLGPGHVGAIAAFTKFAAVQVYEWRDETRGALTRALEAQKLANVTLAALDLDLTSLAADASDGVVSFDEFTYASNPARLALQIARTLKPGAKAVIEAYVMGERGDIGPAFASAFAEPQVHGHDAIRQAMTEAGLDIDSDEDLSPELAQQARNAFETFSTVVPDAPPASALEAREIAWEIQTWRARMKLMKRGVLQRRRFVAHRRA